MASLEQRRLLVKAARLYYEQALTQEEIADRLRLSRQKVQRILRDAREQGVVRISINPIVGVSTELERELEERFSLVEAVIVETTAHEHPPTVARDIGAAAADYLLRVVRPGDRIVIGWGNSLLGMIAALPNTDRTLPEDVTVIQGLGGIGDPNDEFHSTQLVRAAARALGGRPVLLLAPGLTGSPAARDAFYADPNVNQVLQLARSADVAFTGIGSPGAETIRVPELRNTLTDATVEELTKLGAAGSINLRYFDENGQPVPSRLDQCTIGLTLPELKKIRRVVGVAGGAQKVGPIRAALAGRLIDVLVTDHITAQCLVDNKPNGHSGRHATNND